MSEVTTKFSPGETCYIVTSAGEILPLTVSYVRVSFSIATPGAEIIYIPREDKSIASRHRYFEREVYTLPEAKVLSSEILARIIAKNEQVG